MTVRFTLAVCDGQPVVIEERPDIPMIVHAFDSHQEALDFYERNRPEPLDPALRAAVLEGRIVAGGGRQ